MKKLILTVTALVALVASTASAKEQEPAEQTVDCQYVHTPQGTYFCCTECYGRNNCTTTCR